MKTSTSPKPSGGCAWPFFFVIVTILGFAAFVLYLFQDAAKSMVGGTIDRVISAPERVARALGEALKSEVKITNTTLTVKPSEIRELALHQQEIVAVTVYTREFAGQKAAIVVKGRFVAKVGFDLTEMGPVQLNLLGQLDEKSLPQAKLLSLTQKGDLEIVFKSDTWINQVNSQDMEKALAENLEHAQREADSLGLSKLAQASFQRQFESLLRVQEAEAVATEIPLPVAP